MDGSGKLLSSPPTKYEFRVKKFVSGMMDKKIRVSFERGVTRQFGGKIEE